ncbi:MAG: hypothetical protein HS102_14420 [Planctomycetia bacterium]|nr:hypothetical protein [Planctomycetia bacterium]
MTQIKVYETAGQASPPTTNISYSFYDDATDKVQLKEIVITHPAPSTGKNGSGSSTVEKGYFDKRNGRLRWEQTCPGYVNYFAYDDATGRQTVHVRDVNTSSLPSIISSTWDGAAHGGLTQSGSVPYNRSGSGSALDLEDKIDFDPLGRRRKVTDAEGTISFYAYMDDAARVYPAWNTSTYKTLLPIRVVETDKDGRPEKILALDTDFSENRNASNEPIGTATYTNSQIVRWTQNAYNISGMLESTDRYHSIPTSGSGTRYTHFYRTVVEYDSMGRVEFVIADVANTAGSGPPQTYDTEQITEMAYDFLGRTTATKEVVSDETNDVTGTKPDRITTAQYYYDDPDSDSTPEQGEGDGNLRWVRRWFGSGASDYNDTEMRFDWRNRLCLTIPPAAPFTLMAYDHLDRVTATGQYSATTNLDPGDDPATTENGNRLRLSKTLYDEWDRVYRTEEYTDPGAATPANPLTTDNYYDCRSLVWAVDAPNTGITFNKYDGADRLIETFQGTQFDTTKYSSGAPDYPDDNEGIVQYTTYTLSDTDEIEQVLTRELNHTDTDGMDLTGTVDYIRTYVYNWFDAAHRLTGTANYGTNNSNGWQDNSSAPTYGASVPDRSDTVLVTTYTYNTSGRRSKVTDPRGLDTAYTFDALDRVTQMDENDGGSPERITKYEYNGLSSMSKIIADIATDQQTEYVYADDQNARWVTKIRYPNPSTGAPSDSAEDTITFTYNKDGILATRTDQNGTVLTWVYDALRRKTEEEVTTLGSYTSGAGAVDGAVRALTWTYRSDGQVEFITSHSDTTPDTTNWTDAVNQVKYEYNTAYRLDKEKLEYDGKVDGSTPYVTYNYGYSSSDNRYRLNNIVYPNSKKLWYGYTHTGTSTTFEDTINDTFSRVGQVAFDNGSSAIGDIIAEYSFNGLGRLAIRNHDDASGWYGNDLKLDYYGGTSGTYSGLDRFGRVIDQKFVHYATGVPSVNQTRLQYGHDRDSNRATIERSLSPSWSQQLSYDNLNRLTKGQFGYLESATAQLTDVAREWNMDELGNINQTGGLKINGVSEVVKHATNATNEITSLTQANVAGAPAIINDPFTNDTLNGLWAVDKGAASLTSTADKIKFTSLTSSLGKVFADDPTVYGGSFSVKITPNASTGMSGIAFADDSSGSFYAVVLNRGAGTNGKIELYHYASGSWGSVLDSDAGNFSNNSTEYELRVEVRQRQVVASAWDGTTRKAYFKYNSTSMLGTGKVGIVADNTNATFDDFKFHRATPYDPALPGWNSSSAVTLTTGSPGNLVVNGATRGGEAVSTWYGDDGYITQADLTLPTADDKRMALLVRYIDPDNFMGVELRDNGDVNLIKMLDGKQSTVASNTYTPGSTVTVKIKCDGINYTVWVGGVQKISTTDGDIDYGTVGLWAERNGKFENIKAGYDNNADNDIDDAADMLVICDTFTGTSKPFAYDDAGNLVEDDRHRYQYDAWNRLVLAQRIAPDGGSTDTTTLHTAEFDALGRRIEKIVSNSGDLDGTFRYWYHGQQMIEVRDGSSNVLTQAYYGTQYIDEIVALKLEHGYAVVSQDANYNVTTLTDLAGRVLERVFTSEYGQPIIESERYFGDYDGDGDLDSSDSAAADTAGACRGSSPSGACRVLDTDQDGDVDGTDYTTLSGLVSAAPTTNRVHHTRRTSPVGNIFLHQSLVYDAEIGAYQNRAREYTPTHTRYAQTDPIGFADSLNLYAAYRLNPLTHRDPSGLQVRPPYHANDCQREWLFHQRPPGWTPRPPCLPGSSTGGSPIPPPGCESTAGVTPIICFGGTCAVADGPLPVGDVIFLGCVFAAGIIWCWAKVKPIPIPIPAPPPKTCLPCKPPVGTGAYRVDTGHDHYPYTGPHTHHYVMMQSPPSAGCICFWHKTGVTPGSTPLPGEVPIVTPGGGGIAP